MSREAGRVSVCDGAIQHVHFVSEDRGHGCELATCPPFLFVDCRELGASGIVDTRRQSAEIDLGLTNIGAGGVTPGVVVFALGRWPGKRTGIGGASFVGLVSSCQTDGSGEGEEGAKNEPAFRISDHGNCFEVGPSFSC